MPSTKTTALALEVIGRRLIPPLSRETIRKDMREGAPDPRRDVRKYIGWRRANRSGLGHGGKRDPHPPAPDHATAGVDLSGAGAATPAELAKWITSGRRTATEVAIARDLIKMLEAAESLEDRRGGKVDKADVEAGVAHHSATAKRHFMQVPVEASAEIGRELKLKPDQVARTLEILTRIIRARCNLIAQTPLDLGG